MLSAVSAHGPRVVRACLLLSILLVALPTVSAAESPATVGQGGWTAPVLADGLVYVARRQRQEGDLFLALDAMSGEERWCFQAEYPIFGTATVADGVVYVGDDLFQSERGTIQAAGTLYALDAATGQERWRATTNRGIRAAPTVVDGVVYVSDDFHNPGIRPGGTVYAVAADTGEEHWRFAVGDFVCGAPAVVAGTVFVRAGNYAPARRDGLLVALDAATGAERWRFVTSGCGDGTAHQPAASPATVVAETVYVEGADDQLHALDILTGEERWRAGGWGRLPFRPVAADGLIFLATDDGSVVALDAASGAERWHAAGTARLFRPPTVTMGSVVVGSFDAVTGFDADTGDVCWRSGSTLRSPVISNDTVYVAGSIFVDVIAVDAVSGEVRWQVGPQNVELTPITADAELVFVAGDDGRLRALEAATGRLRWVYDVDDEVP